MRFTTAFTLPAFIYAIPFCIIFSISWAIAQHNSQNPSSLEWENLTVELMSQYSQERYDVQALKSLPKEEYVVKSETEELVDYAFNYGYLCNDEDKAMCLQKTEKEDYRTIKRLSVVAYFFLFSQRPYVYKIEFVDEKITFISPEQDAPHNLVGQNDWGKYKEIEKILIEQTIIRDGDISLIAGSMIPLDGQPDFIFKNTYVETKDNTLIHAETNTLKVDKEAPTMLKKYIEEMLEYLRKRYV
jgi:hypothetical protein